MQGSSVLVLGARGLGVEVAKNVVLMGVRKLTIRDQSAVEIADLSSNFFAQPEDVGKNRASTILPGLASLNPRVELAVDNEGELDDEFIKRFTVVVASDNRSLSELKRIGDVCHANGVRFIATDSRGLFGAVFTDFNEHIVFDKNGEPSKTAFISGISQEQEGVVHCLDTERHDLEDGDVVVLNEVQGMTEVNGVEFTVKVVDPYTFKIGNTSSFGTYQSRGVVQQIKKPVSLSFQPLSALLGQCETDKKISHPDGMKALLHGGQFLLFYHSLLAYQEEHEGNCPRPVNPADLAQLLAVAERINTDSKHVGGGDNSEIDRALFRQLAYTSAGDLSPMAAFLGGVVAQEVMKACSGKYLPIDQFLFFDSLNSVHIPDNDDELCAEDHAPRGTRYDGQIAVFGAKFTQQLANLKYFLVGSGAIGCEMLKNWALMGVGTGSDGLVYVTDMDTIEVSNLNRQFLFRLKDVGRSKAEVAAAAVLQMNQEFRVQPMTIKVAPETSVHFTDSFWQGLSGVCNALDNVEARKYVDSLCVRHGKSLLESGTLGPKGNTQVIVPHMTESYSSSADPPATTIPLCTLHTFPSKIEHTLAWSRQVVFQELFVDRMDHVNKYFSTDDYIQKREQISRSAVAEGLEKDLLLSRPASFSDCVTWAMTQFYEYFRNAIMQLLTVFPSDFVDSKTGAPFWTGSKRAPTPLEFDVNSQEHLDFVVSAAFLRAFCFGIIDSELKPADYQAKRAEVATLAAAFVAPPFVPKNGAKVVLPTEGNNGASSSSATSTSTVQDDADAEDLNIKRIVAQLAEVSKQEVAVIEFEKDDDRNFHVDFVNAASNLRAMNYEIPTVDRLQSKLIAGKIIPAMITTTAAVAGLVCFELYKLHMKPARTLEQYKNSFLNLAISLFQESDPVAPASAEFAGKPFTLWDRIDIEGDLTFQELFQYMKETYQMDADMVTCGQAVLFSSWLSDRKSRLSQKISHIWQTTTKNEHAPDVLGIDVMGELEDGSEIESMPPVFLHLRKAASQSVAVDDE